MVTFNLLCSKKYIIISTNFQVQLMFFHFAFYFCICCLRNAASPASHAQYLINRYHHYLNINNNYSHYNIFFLLFCFNWLLSTIIYSTFFLYRSASNCNIIIIIIIIIYHYSFIIIYNILLIYGSQQIPIYFQATFLYIF